MSKITVNYPTMEKTIILSESEAKALGYKKEIARYEPVNRTYRINLNKPTDLEALCKKITGLTRTEYQNAYGQAWSE